MMDHESIRQAIAAHALDAMDDAERARAEHEILEHVPGCEECLAMVRDLREVAADLAIAAGPRAVSPELQQRVMGVVREEAAPASRGSRRRSWVVRAAAIAAALALVASWSLTATLLGRDAGHDAIASAIAVLGDPGAKVAAMRGPAGSLVVAVRADGTVALLGEHVPAAGSGRVLELWLLRDGAPVPVELVTPDGGRVALVAHVTPGDYDAVAITSERGFVQAPSSTPLYSGTL